MRNHLQLVHKLTIDESSAGESKKPLGIDEFFKPSKVSPARATAADENCGVYHSGSQASKCSLWRWLQTLVGLVL